MLNNRLVKGKSEQGAVDAWVVDPEFGVYYIIYHF